MDAPITPLAALDVALRGITLIEASAGTGKTYTITTLYVRLLLEAGLDVGKILVVTYTNAATAELRTRIRERLVAALAALEGRDSDDTMLELARRRIAAGPIEPDCRALRAALHGFDDAAIFTIHGFCQRVLQEHAFESGTSFAAQLITDQTAFLDEVVRDFWVRELYAAPADFVRYLQAKRRTPETLLGLAVKAARHPDMPILVPLEDVVGRPSLAAGAEGAVPERARRPPSLDVLEARWRRLQLALVDFVRAELPRRKERADVQYFDDLLHRLDGALGGPAGAILADRIRRRLPAALIDEFQDTDAAQYRIFHRVYAHPDATLFLVGDPKQAIYAFRGADVFAYMRAKRDAASTRPLLLNWRSDPSLVQAINTLFTRADDPFVFEQIPFHAGQAQPDARDALGGSAGGPPLRFLYAGGAAWTAGEKWMNKPQRKDDFCAPVASAIQQLLRRAPTIDGRPVEPGDIAVLCRTNDQTAMMQQALRDLGVPSVVLGDRSVFDTEEALHVERVLHAVVEPDNAGAVRAALTTPIFGFDGAQLFAVQQDERQWDECVRRFQTWRDTWITGGLTMAFRRLLDDAKVHERLLELPDGERRLTNILHLGELLQSAVSETRRGPRRVVEWLGRVRRDIQARADVATEAAQIRLESDARAVKLVTIHKSKGLEYPIVFCPFLWDGSLLIGDDKEQLRFHDPRHDDRLTLDLGATLENKERAELEALAENLRLLYVAFTRAKHLCVVVWGRFRVCRSSALGYLLHQPRAAGARGGLVKRTSEHIFRLSDEQMLADLRGLEAASGGTIGVEMLPPPIVRAVERGRTLRQAQGERTLRQAQGERTLRQAQGERTLRQAQGERKGSVEIDPPTARAEPFDFAQGALVEARSGRELSCRTTQRVLHRDWRTSSFSGLTAGGSRLPAPAEEGMDRDETADAAVEAEAGQGDALRFVDFPAGPRPGLLVHRIFELLDFARAEVSAVRDIAARAVAEYGVASEWVDPLCHAIGEILDAPLDEAHPPLTLRRVTRARRLSELEFVFPVGHEGEQVGGHVTPARLAEVFAAPVPPPYQGGGQALPERRRRGEAGASEPEPPPNPLLGKEGQKSYAQHLRQLGFAPLRGYLKGFVDLVFEHGGRWYLVDYKSNRLGTRPEDYGPDRLRDVMQRHHYILQYHLYAVALHRYLRQRISAYDYDTHAGGVYYLFVRGMSPRNPPGCGVFYDRPPRARIERLSTLLGEVTHG